MDEADENGSHFSSRFAFSETVTAY